MGKVSVYTDGACKGNPGPMGIGVRIESSWHPPVNISEPAGNGTNNQAEYLAVCRGLQEAVKMGATEVILYTDSQVVQRQLCGVYQCKDTNLQPLWQKASALMDAFRICEVHHIEREHNGVADKLSSDGAKMPIPVTTTHLERLRELLPQISQDSPWEWSGLQVEDGHVYVPEGSYLGSTMITLTDTYEGSGVDCLFVQEAVALAFELLNVKP